LRTSFFIETIDTENAGVDSELDKQGNYSGGYAFNMRRAAGAGRLASENSH
jgi:hypothetical protein